MPDVGKTLKAALKKQVFNVLAVEDSEADRYLLRNSTKRCMDLTFAQDLRGALSLLKKHQYDAVLLDLNLPDSNDYMNTAVQVQAHAGCPVIALSGLHNIEIAKKTLAVGIVAFIVKGVHTGEDICGAVHAAVGLHRSSLQKTKMAMLGMGESVPPTDSDAPQISGLDPASTTYMRMVAKEAASNSKGPRQTPKEMYELLEQVEFIRAQAKEADRAEREAQVGRVMLWFGRHSKTLLAIAVSLCTLSGVGWKWYGQVQVDAEARVERRLADTAQKKTVEANTAAAIVNTKVTGDLITRMGKLETGFVEVTEAVHTVLEVQMANPATRRALKKKPALKKRVDKAAGLSEE